MRVQSKFNSQFSSLCSLLFIGFILNLCVAWACGVVQSGRISQKSNLFTSRTLGADGAFRMTSGFGYCYVVEMSFPKGTLARMLDGMELQSAEMPSWWTPNRTVDEFQSLGRLACGWPFPAFSADIAPDPTSTDPRRIPLARYIQGGVLLNGEFNGSNAPNKLPLIIPLRPIWIGVVNNTIAYAVSMLIVGGTCRALIRRHRDRHYKCLVCGYPRGDSAVCTECGNLLQLRLKTSSPLGRGLG